MSLAGRVGFKKTIHKDEVSERSSGITPEPAEEKIVSARHTRGPWRTDGEGIRTVVRGDDGTIVSVRHRLSAAEHEANARLIAAAPELLDALKLFFDNSLRADWPADIYDSAEAAIAKATGQAA